MLEFMQIMRWPALIIGAAILNHVRGGGGLFDPAVSRFLDGKGRGVFWAAPGIAVMSLLVAPWDIALQLGVAYLIWGIPTWGRWFYLGRLPRVARTSDFIVLVEAIGGSSDYACFTIRNLICLAPIIIVSPFLYLLAPLQTAAYDLGLRIPPGLQIGYCELIEGALWGLMIAIAGYFGLFLGAREIYCSVAGC